MAVLSETYQGTGAFAEIVAYMNRVARMLNNVRVFGNGYARVSEAGISIYVDDGSSAAMPFDLASSDATTGDIELVAGDIEIHGDGGTTYKTPSTLTHTISTSGTVYVGVECEYSGGAWQTPVLISGASKPASDDTTYRKLLWEFDDGAPVKQYHGGNVEFVGWRQG